MKLRALSPVHIGHGKELTVTDFIPLDNNTIAVLDTERLFEKLVEVNADVDEILSAIRDPESLPNHYIWEAFLRKYGIDVSDVKRYTLKVVGEPGKRSMRIREFIKTGGRPYVPGSSVKGSIRTAVFYYVALNNLDRFNKFVERLATDKINKKQADDWLEAEIFGYAKGKNGQKRYEPKSDPMRALIVRDSQPFGLRHLKVYAVSTVGGKGNIPQYVEGAEDFEIEMEVSIDKGLIERGLREGRLNGLLAEMISSGNDFEELIWEAVDSFAEEIIRFERENLRRYGKFERDVKEFYSRLENVKGHKLRIGWGSGWYSMTLGSLLMDSPYFQEIRRKLGLGKPYQAFPKTRRVANSKPMAWVVLV